MAVVVFFLNLYWGNDVLWFKRTSTKKLPNRIRYQIWYNGCLKGKFGRGVQIRGRSKSAVTPEEAIWATLRFGNGTVLPKVQSTRKLRILSGSLDILLFLRYLTTQGVYSHATPYIESACQVRNWDKDCVGGCRFNFLWDNTVTPLFLCESLSLPTRSFEENMSNNVRSYRQ